MRNFLGSLTGKIVRLLLSYRRAGGHALPGLIIERLFPDYVGSMLAQLPEGYVIVTGTNGKTTTTKIITHLLKANGKKVLTNPTGSNLIRGIASSLAWRADHFGRLKYDIAVLEVDEATARLLVGLIKPRWVLALNVSRDQLDRYGEVDTIASLIGVAMGAATEGVVTNSRDPYLVKQAEKIKKPVIFFAAAPRLANFFPNDYQLAAVDPSEKKTATKSQIPDVELTRFNGQKVEYTMGGKKLSTTLKLSGQHNFLNAAAALALCRRLLADAGPEDLLHELSNVSLAFGRGEKYRLKNGAEVELVLVKNPASFSQALLSYGSIKTQLMIAINDKLADGRDVSWLWDVDFSSLKGSVLAVSGTRAADMALRLSYDGIETREIEPRPREALRILSHSPGRKIILSTYTAMLQLYSYLAKNAEKLP